MKRLLFLLLIPVSAPAELVTHRTDERVGFVGVERTITWTQTGGDADWYEMWIYNRETGLLLRADLNIPGTARSYTWTPDRTGHYWVVIRGCVLDDPVTPEPADPWCTASTDSRQDNVAAAFPQGWVYYFKLPPPTDGGIE
jgi:hypothetical protein